MRAELVSGAGNLFVLLDARGGEAPRAAGAREWCEAASELGGRAADGLLVLVEGVDGVRLVVWNADGSPAAACGNGLRCAGWFLLCESGEEEVLLETETGRRRVRGEVHAGGAEALVAGLGEVRRGAPRAAGPDAGPYHAIYPGFDHIEALQVSLRTDRPLADTVLAHDRVVIDYAFRLRHPVEDLNVSLELRPIRAAALWMLSRPVRLPLNPALRLMSA